jgi:hypothetical protein
VLSQAARLQAFLDLGIFGAVILFLFFVTLSGIVKVGIRILWLLLFRLKRRSSPPQGLLLASMILVLALLALTNILMSLAPQYTTYGGQVYNNGTAVVECGPQAPKDACHMSQVSTFHEHDFDWHAVFWRRLQLGDVGVSRHDTDFVLLVHHPLPQVQHHVRG